MLKENAYQRKLINTLDLLFPGCVILKNDPSYQQGILDLIILYRDMWAMLEVKRTSSSHKQPNQQYWVDVLDTMSFASFISRDNEEEVLYELQRSFKIRRPARVSVS